MYICRFRDAASRAEYQVFIHRWPRALNTGLIRVTVGVTAAAAGDRGEVGGGGVQRADILIRMFNSCARGCPMRVRPGRVGRFHGDKGVHRTGIAKTEHPRLRLPSPDGTASLKPLALSHPTPPPAEYPAVPVYGSVPASPYLHPRSSHGNWVRPRN